MDYNTERPQLVFREYGRNVQYMVDHVLTIEDDERRNKAANALIELMGQINPHLRVEEFKPKLWDHIYRMSKFKLEVDFPYDVNKHEEEALIEHKRPSYPGEQIKIKQYGKNVETLIAKAIAMEDEEKKVAFAKVIGNYMKMVCVNRYNENVDDELIIEDLKRLSNGQLVLGDESNLDKLSKSNTYKRRYNNSGRNNRGKNNHRSNGRYDRRDGGGRKKNSGYKKRYK